MNGPAPAPARAPLSNRQIWLSAAGWLVVSRLVVLGLGFIGVATFVDQHTLTVGGAAALDPVTVWHKWDVLWYERIALHGYGWALDTLQGQATAAFFPLYPVSVGALLRVVPGASFFWVGSIVSTACTLVAATLVLRTAATGPAHAQRLMLVLFSAAGSFYFSLPYAEGLFLLLIAGTILLARRRAYVLAGLLAGLAAVTRPQGLALAAVPLLACWLDANQSRAERWRRLAIVVLLIVVPCAIYVAALAHIQGSAGAFIERQALWNEASPYPLQSLLGLLRYPHRVQAWVHGATWLAAVVLLVRYWRRLPLGEALFCAGALLISTQNESFHSIYRYVAVLVPLTIGVAGDRADVRWAVVAANLLLGALMILAFVTNNRLAV